MTKEEIGAILQRIREGAGISRAEVARHLGKSVKTIGHWETGHAQPDADTLFVLCSLYGVNIDDAFGFTKAKDAVAQTQAEIKLLKDYRALNEEGQQKLSAYADDLTQMDKYIKNNHSNVVAREA